MSEPAEECPIGEHDLLHERVVLGSMIRDANFAADVGATLAVTDFATFAHQRVFEAVGETLEACGQIETQAVPFVDADLVVARLRAAGRLEDVGGVQYLGRLIAEAGTGQNGSYYADLVRDASIRRQVRLAGQSIQAKAGQVCSSADDLLDDVQREVLGIAAGGVGLHVVSSTQGINAFLTEVDRRVTSGGTTGVPTGLADLDALTAGLHPGELCVLAARPSVGKTALGTQVALTAAREGFPAALFSLEMVASEIWGRLICAAAGVNSQRVRRGRLSEDELERLSDAAQTLRGTPLRIIDSPAQRVRHILTAARRLKATAGVKLVVIDYLQLVEPDDRRVPRHEQVSEISRRLKLLARDLDLPVLCLTQLNRDVEKRGDNSRPRLSDIRESGAVEQNADTVIFLHRPQLRTRSHAAETETVEAIVAKQRNGATGDVTLVFNKGAMRFENFAPDIAA